jgi:hypothetical protein
MLTFFICFNSIAVILLLIWIVSIERRLARQESRGWTVR